MFIGKNEKVFTRRKGCDVDKIMKTSYWFLFIPVWSVEKIIASNHFLIRS